MIHTPIGARCPKCADLRKLPMFQINSITLVKGVSAGLLSALVLGYIWGAFFLVLLRIPWMFILLPLGIGYAIGEFVSIAVRRKRGTILAYVAGSGVVLTYGWTILVKPVALGYILGDVFFMGSMIFAIMIAISRVK